MNQERRWEPEQTWRAALLRLAIALVVGLGPGRVLAQEHGVLLHDPMKRSPPATAGASEDLGLRPPWAIRALFVIIGLAIWHTTQRLLSVRQTSCAVHAEQTGRFLSEH